MLKLELYIFIRSLPQFSANIYEELERLEPYMQILQPEKGETPTSEAGWYLIYGGKLQLDGRAFQRGDTLYHGTPSRVEVLEPSVVLFFSENALEKCLREEPELGVSLAESMKALKLQWERSAN